MHELPFLHGLARGHAVARGDDDRVGEVEPGQFQGRLRQPDSRLGLRQALRLLVAREGGGAFLPGQHVVFRLQRLVIGLHLVVLPAGDRLLFHQLLVTFIVLPGVAHEHLHLGNARVAHLEVVAYRGNARVHGRLAHAGVLQVCLGLGHSQAVFGVLDDGQRVALAHVAVLLEADFLDEALHAAVHGDDVLAHLGVVRILHPAEVDEAGDDPCEAAEQRRHDDDVEGDFLDFSVHGVFLLNVS